MKRIISIIAFLSIILFPTLAQACQHKSAVQSTLIYMGYMPVFQMVLSNKVAHIYIRDDNAFMFFKIEEDDTVCQIFGGWHFLQYRKRSL